MKTTETNLSDKWADSQWAIRPLVSREVYTDREEHLEYLYKAALDAIGRRTMSTVLLGQRRMGKTEIFKRVVNRLFFLNRIIVIRMQLSLFITVLKTSRLTGGSFPLDM